MEGARAGDGQRRSRRANYGMVGEDRRRRWCAGCAKAHGAVDLVSKKCETCKTKVPKFGIPPDNKRRWCSNCAKEQPGSASLCQGGKNRKIEPGGRVVPSYLEMARSDEGLTSSRRTPLPFI